VQERRGKEAQDSVRINNRIVAREVRVISPSGEQLGIMPTHQAIAVAEEQGLDLVEVAPDSRPPVCRIMDYGKYKYNLKKKQQSAKRRAVSQAVKEVKLRPKTEEHDYQVKLKHINRFLLDGNKVKVTVRFRGRELVHRDIGMEFLQRVIKDVGEMAVLGTAPEMDGKMLTMVMNPSPKALALKRARDEQKRQQGEEQKPQVSQADESAKEPGQQNQAAPGGEA